MQLCYPYYLSVVEPDHYDKNKLSASSTHIVESSNHKNTNTLSTYKTPNIVISKLLSFGDKIALMTKVLYKRQRKEDQLLELDPDNFEKMLESTEPSLKGFFNELYNTFILNR
ncbi:hypothetical protein F8M41_008876 [Gigaspora margarita]|uniref:Uncharacterized protein n=1 Tax=Gigaspora margarita TaxID=4874 RepID=A0A8H3X4N5_GIGMA|nr:hypothetical protein F8M41_008876 [Gigaspora margarita]